MRFPAEAAFRVLRGNRTYSDKKYEAYRNKYGVTKIRRNAPPIGMLNTSRRQNVIARRQKRAGLAKASWRESVRGSGVRASKAKDQRMRIRWPREANTPLRQFKSRKAGSGSIKQSGTRTEYMIASHVDYADEISAGRRIINGTTQRRMRHYFKQRAAALARQSNRVKSLSQTNQILQAA